jgi:pilus assembly protein Flp/PilA
VFRIKAGEALVRCKKGATAIEYGLIAAGIALAISIAVLALGPQLSAIFSFLAGKITPS